MFIESRAEPPGRANRDHDLTGSGIQVPPGDDRRHDRGAAADVVDDDVALRFALPHLGGLRQVTSIDIPHTSPGRVQVFHLKSGLRAGSSPNPRSHEVVMLASSPEVPRAARSLVDFPPRIDAS